MCNCTGKLPHKQLCNQSEGTGRVAQMVESLCRKNEALIQPQYTPSPKIRSTKNKTNRNKTKETANPGL
jgi:hypothetical protein